MLITVALTTALGMSPEHLAPSAGLDGLGEGLVLRSSFSYSWS